MIILLLLLLSLSLSRFISNITYLSIVTLFLTAFIVINVILSATSSKEVEAKHVVCLFSLSRSLSHSWTRKIAQFFPRILHFVLNYTMYFKTLK